MIVNVGDRVRITHGSNVYEGILMPLEGTLKETYVSVKLDNGYNVGFSRDDVSIELLSKGRSFNAIMPEVDIPYNEDLPDVAILGTGGTVASKIDYMTGAVYPAFSPEELMQLVPELGRIANIEGKEILSIVSEDITFSDWKDIGREVVRQYERGCDGIVVTHGTDTLHFTSSMLSFMLKNIPHPLVLVGAQRSSDRPSSDAALNLISAVNFAGTDCREVTVCMHADMNDDYCYVHRGTRVRKFHTSRRDAFATINGRPLAKVPGSGPIEYLSAYRRDSNSKEDLSLDTDLEEHVALVKTYPTSSDIVAHLVDKGYRGIILEGSGLGHTPHTLHEEIRRGVEEGVVFGMTSQCVHGRVNMNVYRGGRILKEMGVIPLGDMLAETAWCKLSWVLGHANDYEDVRSEMLRDVAGELESVSRIDAYNVCR
ncbi:Glu-tRNA(Gln) amidotransferase subunit GatD [archaeon]|nr:MAG: Glu-tRNA(Gln) amidotransferase subunit GatD [archaeon]